MSTVNASRIQVTGETHPVAELFPLMREDQIRELAQDIGAHGLREALWIDPDGRILDGRNRFRACVLAGVEPVTRVYDGPADSLVPFVVSLNLHRRHLDEGQRAMVAGRLANLSHGGNRGNQYTGGKASIDALPQSEAAELLNVSRPSVQRARVVLDHGTPDLVAAVDAGEIAVSAAADVAALEPEVQDAIISDVRAGTPAREAVRQAVVPHVAHNSRNNEWYTPPHLIEAAREAMGGIDCDPCSSATANRTVRARRFYTIEDDGLTQAKWGRRVWMNPPYGQPQMGQFLDALVARYAQGDVHEACVLLNNVTETEAFQTLASVASAICFLKGRVKFLDHTGTPALQPLQGQVVVYLGESSEQPSRFCEAFEGCGVSMVAYPGMSGRGSGVQE